MSNLLTVGLENREDPAFGHQALNVATLGMAVGIEMGLNLNQIRTLGISGLVQSFGSRMIPERVRQATVLSDTDVIELRMHPIHTANALQKFSSIPQEIQMIVYQMYERNDGSGYPREWTKNRIHPLARVLHIAAFFVNMTTARPYRRPWTAYGAVANLLDKAKRQIVDSDAVRGLLKVVSLFPIGSFVRLSDNTTAQVLRPTDEEFTKPIILRVDAAHETGSEIQDHSGLIDLRTSELSVVEAISTPGRDEVMVSADEDAAVAL